jgi:hypothetical protein
MRAALMAQLTVRPPLAAPKLIYAEVVTLEGRA